MIKTNTNNNVAEIFKLNILLAKNEIPVINRGWE